ncbi:MAG: tandem-95 repeat protein [Verrucomicrobia bacterium]|nr:tandem-95 repeat protein [Verrucomicrobiota bacterium]
MGIVTNALGWLTASNEVTYSNCFSCGLVKGSIRYRLSRAGLAQDLLLAENIGSPQQRGLPAEATEARLELMTAFDESTPTPVQRGGALARSIGAGEVGEGVTKDTMLLFGPMRMIQGRAFLHREGAPDARGRMDGARVRKEFITVGRQKMLIESVEHRVVKPLLDTLPVGTNLLSAVSAAPRSKQLAALAASSSARQQASAPRTPARIQTAKAIPSEPSDSSPQTQRALALVLDYELVLSGSATFTARGNTSYLINGFTGIDEVTLEGNAVLKFDTTAPDSALCVWDKLVCQTDTYRPAIFTSRSDDSVGEAISVPNTPLFYNQALYLAPEQSEIQHVRVAYAQCALQGAGFTLSHAQIIHCPLGLISGGGTCRVNNVLMYDVGTAFTSESSSIEATHLTVDQCARLTSDPWCGACSSLTLTNSLLVNVTNQGDASLTLDHTESVSSATTVFQTVGAGAHYLAKASLYRDRGTTNLPPALRRAILERTTYPPAVFPPSTQLTVSTNLGLVAARDVDDPDLGYHAPPLDYLVSSLLLPDDGIVTVLPGVTIALYGEAGFKLTNHSTLLCEGTRRQRIQFVHAAAVQELSAALPDSAYPVTITAYHTGPATNAPDARFRFVDFNALSGAGAHLGGSSDPSSAYATLSVRDSAFYGGSVQFAGPGWMSCGVTNTLFERTAALLEGDLAVNLFNNVVRGADWTINAPAANRFLVCNNAFDEVEIAALGEAVAHTNNAYLRLPDAHSRFFPIGNGDLVLTNFPAGSVAGQTPLGLLRALAASRTPGAPAVGPSREAGSPGGGDLYALSSLPVGDSLWTDLEGWYAMENGLADAQGEEPLTMNGSGPTYVTGKPDLGQAASLTPASGNNFPSRTPFYFDEGYTYCAWIKIPSTSYGTLLANSGYGGSTLRCENSQFKLWHYTTTSGWVYALCSGITVQTGNWYFVCARWSPATGLILNVNTTQSPSTDAATYSATSSSIQYLFRVGYEGWGGSEKPGTFDEVAIWERALTDEEVSRLYNNDAGMTLGSPWAVAPTFSPNGGNITTATPITIASTAPGATITYSVNGGTSQSGPSPLTITLSQPGSYTLTAYATAPGYTPSSTVMSQTYVVTAAPQAAAPTFSPNGGNITTATPITIASTTPGATITYSVNGGTSQSGPSPLTIILSQTGSCTLSASATAPGYAQSATATSLPYIVTASSGDPLWTGLQAWYKLDGNLNDTEGGAALTVNGNPPPYDTGKLGQAANLTPVAGNNYLSHNSFDFRNYPAGYTYYGWVKPASTAYGTLLANSGYGGSTLRCNSGHIWLWHYTGQTWLGVSCSDITISPGTWYFVCARWNRATSKLLLDVWTSQQLSQQELPGANDYFADGRNYPYLFRLGFEGWGGSEMAAAFDEVGVWNRALSDIEVLQLWNNGNGITRGTTGGTPPAITTQPAAVTVAVGGGSVSLTVGANGMEPMTYQWYLDEALVPGAIAATLTLTSVEGKHGGNYKVRVSNSAGFVDSENAKLIVQAATPTFDPDGGNVTTTAPITLRCSTPGATIWYNIDGQTWLNGTAPVGIYMPQPGSRIVRAYATAPCCGLSPTATSTAYVVEPAGVNNPPTIALPGGAALYMRGHSPVVLDAAAAILDDSDTFAGAVLSADIVMNRQAGDRVLILPNDDITVTGGGDVQFRGTSIGTFSGASGPGPLTVTLNAGATLAATEALVRRLAFDGTAATPTTLRRVQLLLKDGGDESSSPVEKVVYVDCAQKLDVMLLIDASGSLSAGAFADEVTVSENFIAGLSFSDDLSQPVDQAGAIKFCGSWGGICTEPLQVAPLSGSKNAALTAIDSLRPFSQRCSGTQFQQPLELARRSLLAGRPDAVRGIILMTDGQSHPDPNEQGAVDMARQAKLEGSRIITIGFGSYNRGFLEQLASSLTDFHAAPDTSGLQALLTDISGSFCRSGNASPIADAGLDGTVFCTDGGAPRSFIFGGSAHDDGLPNGTLTYSLTQLSGPLTVAITSPNGIVPESGIVAPRTTFSQPGQYIFELAVSDSQFTARDQVIVNVRTIAAPVVDAGPDRRVNWPPAEGLTTVEATLSGSVWDDGVPFGSMVSAAWTGPGGVTIAEPSAWSTTASFSQPGSYKLTLTATKSFSGGSVSGHKDMLVTVAPADKRTFTRNVDFVQGYLMNVHFQDDELRLNTDLTTFPFVNIALTALDTVARIDANTGRILGEYRTKPESTQQKVWPGSPSRTTVDRYGNVWVANRGDLEVCGADDTGSITRIGVVIGGTRGRLDGATFTPDAAGEYLKPPFVYSTCVDKDGDGYIRTSGRAGQLLSWVDGSRPNRVGRIFVCSAGSVFLSEGIQDTECDLLEPGTGETCSQSPCRHTSAYRLADWLGSWLQAPDGGRKFYAYSASTVLGNIKFSTIMERVVAASPTGDQGWRAWTDADPEPLTLDFLLSNGIDALFLQDKWVDPGVLEAYVLQGGNVFLAGGLGSVDEGNPSLSSDWWNGFLNRFGLSFSDGTSSTAGYRDVLYRDCAFENMSIAYRLGLTFSHGNDVLVNDPVSATYPFHSRLVDTTIDDSPVRLFAVYEVVGQAVDAQDEAIINYVRTVATGARTLAVDAENNVWVGGVGKSGYDAPDPHRRWHEKINGATGERIVGTAFQASCGGYGGLIDSKGYLWSARLSGGDIASGYALLRYDTSSATSSCLTRDGLFEANYGLAIDPKTGQIWFSKDGTGVNPKIGVGVIRLPHAALVENMDVHVYTQHGADTAKGLVVDLKGNVWVAHGDVPGATTVGHLLTDGSFIGNVELPCGIGPTGVAVDSNGKIWVANYDGSAMRIDPNAGPKMLNGIANASGQPVGQVDMVVPLPAGSGPYNYSDMTGFVSMSTTDPAGTWTVVHEASLATVWQAIQWNAYLPSHTRAVIEARASDDRLRLPAQPFLLVAEARAPDSNPRPFLEVCTRRNEDGGRQERSSAVQSDLPNASWTVIGSPYLPDLNGKFIEIRVTLGRDMGATETPKLYDLTVSSEATDSDPIATNLQSIAQDDHLVIPKNSGPRMVDVLANDLVPAGGTFMITDTTPSQSGTISVVDGGQGVEYAPHNGFSGHDWFVYTIDDGNGGSSQALVTLTVADVETTTSHLPIIARDDHLTAIKHTPTRATVLNVLANDTDPENGPLQVLSFTQAQHGTVERHDGCVLKYTPSADASVTKDFFTYTVTDGAQRVASATVILDLVNANSTFEIALVADGQRIPLVDGSTVDFGVAPSTLTFSLHNLGNVTLTFSPCPTITSTTIPSPFTGFIQCSLEPGQSVNFCISFQRPSSTAGMHRGNLTFPASGGGADALTLNFVGYNPPSQQPSETPTVEFGHPANHRVYTNGEAIEVKVTASARAPGASISHVDYVLNSASRRNTGNFTYIDRAAAYVHTFAGTLPIGEYTLTATAYDTQNGASAATLALSVVDPNQPPVAGNDEATVQMNEAAGVKVHVMLNDHDPDGDPITLISFTKAAGQVDELVSEGVGTFLYTPPPDTFGRDGFSYVISDGKGGTARGHVTVTILKTDAPSLNIAAQDQRGTPLLPNTYAWSVWNAWPRPLNLAATILPAGQTALKVEFWDNGVMIGEVVPPSFQMEWSDFGGGDHEITAIRFDSDGNAVARSAPLFFAFARKPSNIAPTARISTVDGKPASGTLLVTSGRLQVEGQAFDGDTTPDAITWRLNLYSAHGEKLATLGHGSDPVGVGLPGSFGTYDLTQLQNGVYDLELAVSDGSDRVSTQVRFILQSELKMGQLLFTEQDLVIPAGGLPIAVLRRYDSLNLNQGDFGYGWTFALTDLDLELDEERGMARDLDDEDFSLRTGGGRDVTLTLPDGRRTTFMFELKPVPPDDGVPSFAYVATWNSPPGVAATLGVSVSPKLITLPGGFYYWEEVGPGTPLENFDFRGFVLTNEDGTEFHIEREDQGAHWLLDEEGKGSFVQAYGKGNVNRVKRPNGEAIEISANRIGIDGKEEFSIQHVSPSDCRTHSIAFKRDAKGRIKEAYDADGLSSDGRPTGPPTIKYEYDSNGNLITVSKLRDQNASQSDNPFYETITYEYDLAAFPHYLTEITDYRGVKVARQEYYSGSAGEPAGSKGRLKSIESADGRVSSFAYDFVGPFVVRTTAEHPEHVAVASQVITDSEGLETRHETDGSGNVLLTVDPLRNRTERWFDSKNNLTKQSVQNNDGTEVIETRHDYLYFSDQPNKVQRHLTIAPANGNEVVQSVQKFDRDGRLIMTIDAKNTLVDTADRPIIDADQTPNPAFCIEHTYDPGTHELSVTTANRSGSPLVALAQNTYYDTGDQFHGLLRLSTDALDNQTIYGYYDGVEVGGRFGDLKQVDNADASGTVLARTTYKYDARGNRTHEIRRQNNGVTWVDYATTETKYDARSRVTEVIDAEGGHADTVYDDAGRVGSTTDRYGATTRYTYDAVGDLIQTEYADTTISRKVVYYETVAGHANKLRHVVMEDRHLLGGPVFATRTTHDELGRPIQTERLKSADISLEPDGTVLKAKFNRGTVVSVTQQTTYDFAGRVSMTADANGKWTKYEYDGAGRRWRVKAFVNSDGTDIAGTTITTLYGYDPNGNQLWVLDANQYDSLSQSPPDPNPLAGTPWQVYESLYGSTSPSTYRERLTHFEYDDFNRCLKTHLPSIGATPAFTETRYNDLGQAWLQVDADTKATAFVYDGLGRVTWVITDVYTTPTPSALPSTLPTTTTGWETWAKGTRFASDSTATHFDYDDLSNLKAQRDARNQTTTFDYDLLGRRTRRTLPDTTTERWRHDVPSAGAFAQRYVHVDFATRATVAVYDVAGRIVQKMPASSALLSGGSSTVAATGAVNPAGANNALKFTAGSVGSGPNGNALVFLADDAEITTDAALASYEASGQVLVVRYNSTLTRAVTVQNAVNQVSRLPFAAALDTSSSPGDGSGNNGTGIIGAGSSSDATWVSFEYAPAGQRSRMVDNKGTSNERDTRYAYDEFGRLKIKQSPEGTLNYSYDAAGNVLEISARHGYTFSTTQPWLFSAVNQAQDSRQVGAHMSYTYDNRNRLGQVFADPDQTLLRATYGYDPAGNLATVACANNVTSSYSYNARNQLRYLRSANGGTMLASFDYDDYDAGDGLAWPADRKLASSGQRRGVREVLPAGGASYPRLVGYAYDALRRLTKEGLFSGAFATETGYVQYDGTAGYADSSGYDPVGNRRQRVVNNFLTVTPRSYASYDSRDRLGNTLAAGTAAATWDANGNTLQFNLNGDATWDQATADGYDLENRLVSATRAAGAIGLVYDGDGNRVKKTVNGVTTCYLVDDRNPTGYAQVLEEQAVAGGTPSVTYVFGLDLVSQDRSGTVHYFGYDGLGSVRYLTTSANPPTVSDTYTYDAFGVQIASSGAGTANNYRFAGEQWDADLGTYYVRARYYHPDLGRFWTMDGFEGNNTDPLSLHKYLYCHANPVNGIDPSGHENLISLNASTGIILGLSAWMFSPHTANAPGPNDPTYPDTGDVDMVINIFGGHLIGKVVGVGVAAVKVGYSKLVGYVINRKGPVATVRPTASTEIGGYSTSFENGLYTQRAAPTDMIVYRAEGGTSGNFGRFFGTEKPVSAVDAEIMSNIMKHGNEVTTLVTYRIPKGTIIYEGRVAGGSGQQIFIPNPRASGVSLISSEPLPLKIVNPSDAPVGSLLD